MKKIIFLFAIVLGVASMATPKENNTESVKSITAATATYNCKVIRAATQTKSGVVGLYQRIECENGTLIGETMVQSQTYTFGTVINQAYADAWYNSLPQLVKDTLNQLVVNSNYLCP
jgi:hypothetical protein